MKKIFYKVVYKVTYKDGRKEEIKTGYHSEHWINVDATIPHKKYDITVLKVDYNDYIVGKPILL